MTEPRHDPTDDRATNDRIAARDTERAATQVRHVLEQRGVHVHDEDTPEELATLMASVEEFELTVAHRGSDSFTNTPQSSDPDREEFVIPARGDDEDAPSYSRRLRARAEELSTRGDR